MNGAWNCEKVKGQEWTCSVEGETVESAPVPVERLNGDERPVQRLALPVPIKTPAKPPPVYVQPPGFVAKRPGWTCTSNDQNETWNCSLVGADPKGETRVVSDPDANFGFFAAAFDYNQELVFETLQSQLKYDPWQSCLSPATGRQQYVSGKDLRNTAPMDVTADYSEVFDKEITSFFGNVEMIRADQKVLSDIASYDTVSETMDAQGHVYYSEDELSLYSDTALLNLGTDEARLRKALFISPSAPIRGSADIVYRDSKVLSRYKTVAFTSCEPGNQDWVVHAGRLKMNKHTGKAAATDAWLEFKGLPVLYTPYISFPLDDRRVTGLLTPTFGNDEDNGFDVTVPYYWSIAPNYD
ncbi:MAG: LPS-assembly protein LptD, partial [Methylococcales bacterium]